MKYDAPFVVLDCETGGLPKKLKKKAVFEVAITEIAMVLIDNESLEIIDKKSWLFKPYQDNLIYDPYAAKASGIDKELCELEGLEMKDIFEDMSKFLKKAKKGRKKPYIVGHNIEFDLDFVDALFEYNKKTTLDFFDTKYFDTIDFSRLKLIENENFKLGTCCETFGIELVEAHRALPDTIATAELWISLVKSLRGSGEAVQKKKIERYRDKISI